MGWRGKEGEIGREGGSVLRIQDVHTQISSIVGNGERGSCRSATSGVNCSLLPFSLLSFSSSSNNKLKENYDDFFFLMQRSLGFGGGGGVLTPLNSTRNGP